VYDGDIALERRLFRHGRYFAWDCVEIRFWQAIGLMGSGSDWHWHKPIRPHKEKAFICFGSEEEA
jgi:hypothetical protein